jgi:hypothetical protein
MIAITIGIVAMAALFVAAGLLQIRVGCGHGHCDSCSNDCEIDKEGRLP